MARRGLAISLAIASGLLYSSQGVSAREVVGFREPMEGVYFAVRGVLVKGAVVTGLRFYSNDATAFPEVLLAADSGEKHPPQPGITLRSVQSVAGQAGYVTAEFPAYEVVENAYFWAVVRFPDNEAFEAAGLGGGPGIGLREGPGGLPREQSFYAATGGFGVYTGFEISLLVQGDGLGKAGGGGGPRVLTVGARFNRTDSGITFLLHLPQTSHTTIDLYDVAGRRVVRLTDRVLPAGPQEVVWGGFDGRGQRVASGIYLYKVRVGEERRTGKVLVIR